MCPASPSARTDPTRSRPAVAVPPPHHEDAPANASAHGAAAEPVHCSACDAVCCRLTVVLMRGDDVPERYTTHTPAGLHVMARDEEGWCVALDSARMCCSMYETRPAICRRFAMGGPYCREVRADYSDRRRRGIPLRLY